MYKFIFNKFKIHRNIYIAFSGGIDSNALLDICFNYFKNEYYILKVIHVNHMYSTCALHWTFFSRVVCNLYNVIIYTCFIKKNKKFSNLEEIFRSFRFKIFLNIIKKNSSLFLGHHFNDLIETFFIRFFRGSSISLFSGLQFFIKIGHLNIFRVFLYLFKNNIFKYVILNDLYSVFDLSNFNRKFFRNFIRFYFFKFLKKINIKKSLILKNINLVINFLKFFNDFFLEIFFTDCINYKSLNINYLNKVSFFLLCDIFRKWLLFNNYKIPSLKNLSEIKKLINSNKNFHSYIKIKYYVIFKIKYNFYLSDFNIFYFKNLKFIYLDKNINKNVLYFLFI